MISGLFGRPRVLLMLCALFWAGNFVISRAVHEAVAPIGLAFWRWLAASLLVMPFVWPALRRQWSLLRAHVGRMLILAVLGVSGFNTLVYFGLQTTTATNSVLIQSTLPVHILMLNWLLFRTAFGGRELASILISLVGVVVIISGGDPRALLELGGRGGDLWALAGALVWALYSVLLRWRPKELQAAAFLGFTLIAGTAVLLPLYLLEHASGHVMSWEPSTLATIAYLAVFPSALAYLFWNRGVAMVGANVAGHFVHLMPLFGTLMAVVFLDETFDAHHATGALLVASGIGLSLIGARRA